MRLLKTDNSGDFTLTDEFIVEHDIPRYAILSHTWRQDSDEVTFEDLQNGSGRNKAGYDKIRFCGTQAAKDKLQYFWVDTCCIKKSSSTELQEAITSMFRWYRKATKCYVYLADVSTNEFVDPESLRLAFKNSRWFRRGWTLQELLAPKSVEFFSREGEFLGDKTTLEQQIHAATDIPITALHGVPLSHFPIQERMRWTEGRQTKRKEDRAYCLLGIFDVFMSLNYGEGENAFSRLEAKISKKVNGNPSIQQAASITHLPFDQMTGFVGRIAELESIERELFDPYGRRIVSLLGLGGIGKSRLALEYAYQIKSKPACSFVLWINASERLTFEKDVYEIGKKLRIPGINDEKADVKLLVNQWLTNSEHRWLLVLDNADDELCWSKRSIPDQPDTLLAQHLPRTTNGSILVTTRSKYVANFLSGKDIIHLGPLSSEDAVETFKNALQYPDRADDRDAVTKLMERLTNLPLAIIQAASFVNMNEISVQTYLELLDQPETEVIKVLSEDFGDASRDLGATNSVITTWLVSFDRIQQNHPLAASMLSYAACLHEKGIPLSLLVTEPASKVDILKAVAVLQGYSFMNRHSDKDSNAGVEELYDMHSLVRLAARNLLKLKGRFSNSIDACIRRLSVHLPMANHKNKSLRSVYMPHARHVIEQNGYGDTHESLVLLQKMACSLTEDGCHDEAMKMMRVVLALAEKQPLLSDQERYLIYCDFGEALVSIGDWSAGIVYLQRALEGQKEMLGPEHRETIASMSGLATAVMVQGNWQQAQRLVIQISELSVRVLGAEHPDTLFYMARLARMHLIGGNFDLAEQIIRNLIETRKKVQGQEHPGTLTAMIDLSTIYMFQGRFVQAEPLIKQVFVLAKKVLGPEHADTLMAMNNLATVFSNQGQFTNAEELYLEVIRIRKKVLGIEHPMTLNGMHDLALNYCRSELLMQAEELFLEVLGMCKRVLGVEHHDTLTVLASLAGTYFEMGNLVQAEELDKQVLETRRKVLGDKHPQTLRSLSNLATIYSQQNKLATAEQLLLQFVDVQCETLGLEDVRTLSSMTKLAKIYSKQNNLMEAQKVWSQIVELRKKVPGLEDPRMLAIDADVAYHYWKHNRLEEAADLGLQVLKGRKKLFGVEHAETVMAMYALAHIYKSQHRDDEAIELLASCVQIQSKLLGQEHAATRRLVKLLQKWSVIAGASDERDGDNKMSIPGGWVD